MMRANASDGRFIIGISADEIRALMDGETLMLNLPEIGGTDVVLVMYGESMAEVTDKLREQFGELPPPRPYPDKPSN